MFKKNPVSSFFVGIILATSLYVMAVMMSLVVVDTIKSVDEPMKQDIMGIRTIRQKDGSLVLKFSVEMLATKPEFVSLIRSLRYIETDERVVLPSVDVVIPTGDNLWNFISFMPAGMKSGVWEYNRYFVYKPTWSMANKIIEYPPIQFRVCDEVGVECRM